MNSPPSSGTITVFPLEAVIFESTFSILCDDWIDDPEDFPLFYTYKARVGEISVDNPDVIIFSRLLSNRVGGVSILFYKKIIIARDIYLNLLPYPINESSK